MDELTPEAPGHWWNYRVIRTQQVTGDGAAELSVGEVYYDRTGTPVAWLRSTPAHGSDLQELADDLALMTAALGRPVLDLADLQCSVTVERS